MKKSIIAATIFLTLATGCAFNNVLNEQQMFTQFPVIQEAKTLVVSGHTDATGSDDLNLELSTARAQTVTGFITQIGLISSDRLSFKGFGKEKSVATNEAVEGRAQNRRVGILIIN